MAKTGNHGIIVPRDRELLHRLYWEELHSLPAIGRMFDVNHKSILYVFRELGIPTRPKGRKPERGCIECGEPVFRIRHAGNGAMYGRRCRKHWNEHRAMLTREEKKTPVGAARAKRLLRRWYLHGPLNPKDEGQWISKSKILLRNVRRFCIKARSREAYALLSEVSEPVLTSLRSCRR